MNKRTYSTNLTLLYKTTQSIVTASLKKVGLLLYPSICIKCWCVVKGDNGFCGPCWKALRFISHPFCHMCALPMDVSPTHHSLCAKCLQAPHPFKNARAVFVYDEASKPFILSFKNKGRTAYKTAFVSLMRRRGEDVIDTADIICPVPLHWFKLLKRGYNQSALLAQGIAHQCNKSYIPDLLIKTKSTKSQAHLPFKARHQNVKKSFAINPKYKHLLPDKKILLVDDVMTTGATLATCAALFNKQPIKSIDVLVLARAT